MDRFEQQQDEEDEQVVTRRSKLAKSEIVEKKKKKPNVNIIISAILISVSIFGYIVIRTNTFYYADSEKIESGQGNFLRVSVETIVSEIESENSSTDTNTTNTEPQIPGVSNTNTAEPNTAQVPEVSNPVGEDTYTDRLDIPEPGSSIDCGSKGTRVRTSIDSWTMEMTVKSYRNGNHTTIASRLDTLKAKSSATSEGAENALLTYTIDNKTYYAVAMIDGFTKPLGAYQVMLDDGSSFYAVAIDVKSRNDNCAAGYSTPYGHGYSVNDKVQMSVVEFSDASTSQTSVYHNSAKQYSNTPNLEGRYVKSVHYLGQLD